MTEQERKAFEVPATRAMWAAWQARASLPDSAGEAGPEPVGWIDEFGNVFPLAAWKPAKSTYHDAHKKVWRPVYTHPAPHPVGSALTDEAIVKIASKHFMSYAYEAKGIFLAFARDIADLAAAPAPAHKTLETMAAEAALEQDPELSTPPAPAASSEGLAELRRLAGCCPELNLSNYGPDDVDELNAWAIEVAQCIDGFSAPAPAVKGYHPGVSGEADREADRLRYVDPDFNRWLDDSIADGGYTVWHALTSVNDAHTGWMARPDYDDKALNNAYAEGRKDERQAMTNACATCNGHGLIGGFVSDGDGGGGGYDSEPCPDCAAPSHPPATPADCCKHGIHYDNACGACVPPRGTK